MSTRDEGEAADRRAGAIRWMDHWVEPTLIFLAACAIPLMIVETGDPSGADASLVIGGTWAIWGAFTANFVVRMVLAEDRTAELGRLLGDLGLIIALPLFTIGERTAVPIFALIPLLVIALRTLQKGRVLRRTGYKLRNDPLRIVAFVVPFVWLLSAALIWRFEREPGTVDSVGDSLWWGVVTLATVGYGDISPSTTAGRVVAVGVMIVGIAMFSIVTAKLAERLLAHRAGVGRSEVLEKDHTLVLGWSPMVTTIVAELVVANRSRTSPAVVVMADMDTEAMYHEIISHVPDLERSNTTLVCRSGNPADPVDIERCRPDHARSIIIVDATKQDAPVVRSVLALLHGQSLPDDVPIIAEIDDPSTAESLESAFGGRVTVVNPTSFIARTAAQVCRDAGVAHAYLELLGFAGSELYAHAVPEAIGRPYGELLPAFTDACVVGLVHADGGSDLNPPMGTVVADGDRVLVVAEDETSITFDAAQPPVTSPALPAAPPPPPERVVIFGWNELAPRIVTELSAYLTEGSRITVVCDPDHTVEDAPGADDVAPCDLEVRMAEGRELLDVIESEQPDHAMVLCYRDGLSPAEADARALVTTLQIRNAIAHQPRETTVVTELLDQRDVALAPPAAAGDFLVSDRLISLLLTQLSEDVRLKPVFDDLLDESGAELYCKPIDRYCQPGTPTTFQQLVVAASRRSESAIGYRRRDLAHDRGARFGIVVNPPKSASLTLVAGDELIVVAEDGR